MLQSDITKSIMYPLLSPQFRGGNWSTVAAISSEDVSFATIPARKVLRAYTFRHLWQGRRRWSHMSQQSVFQSRRFTPRVDTQEGVFVDWCCFGLEDISRVRNLSLDGLFVETRKSRSMGSTVKLEFLVQEGQIRADAVVKRAEPGSGLAMKFTAVTEEDRLRLGALINRFRYSS